MSTWVVDSLERPDPQSLGGAVFLSLRSAQGGRVAAQVVTRWPAAAELSIAVNLPGLSVEVLAVAYVNGIPDALLPGFAIQAQANTTYTWWINIRAGTASPGLYGGTATVTDGVTTEDVSLMAEVLPIELPETWPDVHFNLARFWAGYAPSLERRPFEDVLTALRLPVGDIYYPYFNYDPQELQRLFGLGQRSFPLGKVDSVKSAEEVRAFVESVQALPDGPEILARSWWYGWDEKPESTFPRMAEVFGFLAAEWPQIGRVTSASLTEHWLYPGEMMAEHSVTLHLESLGFFSARDQRDIDAAGWRQWPYRDAITLEETAELRARGLGWVLASTQAGGTVYYNVNAWGNTAPRVLDTAQAPFIVHDHSSPGATGELIYFAPDGSPVPTVRLMEVAAGMEEFQLLQMLADRTSPEFAAKVAKPVHDAQWSTDWQTMRRSREDLFDLLLMMAETPVSGEWPTVYLPDPMYSLRDDRDELMWVGEADVYRVDVGSSPGGADIWTGAPGGNFIAPTWPVDGREAHVTLMAQNQYGGERQIAATYTTRQDVTLSPPGGVLPSGDVVWTWDPGRVLVDGWRFRVGGFDSGDLAEGIRTATVSGLPDDGSAITATLEFLTGWVWRVVTATYTAFQLPGLTAPDIAATLPGRTADFAWSDFGLEGIQLWYLYVGLTSGGREYHSAGPLLPEVTTATLSVPVDGSTVWVRLWWLSVAGVWEWRDYGYTATTIPQIVAPADSSVIVGEHAPVTWTANGVTVAGWQLDAGSAPGLSDLHSEPLDAATLQASVPLPVGQSWIRLGWNDDNHEVAVNVVGGPKLTVPQSPITGPDAVFGWGAGGLDDVAWWYLSIGAAVGGSEIHASGKLSAETTSRTVTGLPVGAVSVRLWWQRSGSTAWMFEDYPMEVLQ